MTTAATTVTTTQITTTLPDWILSTISGSYGTTTTVPSFNYMKGDVNGDSRISIADAAAILQYLGNKDKYGLSEIGKINADCDGIAGLTTGDAAEIQKFVGGMPSKLS